MLNQFHFIHSLLPHLPPLLSVFKTFSNIVYPINSKMCEIELKADGKEVKVKGRSPEEVEKLMQSVKNFTD